ncbi:MAG TPA: hypothetical protein VNT79_00305 [Phycisphaerae bacterium]|nr:hypothetical protein [Phycisphaerae bacterium]
MTVKGFFNSAFQLQTAILIFSICANLSAANAGVDPLGACCQGATSCSIQLQSDCEDEGHAWIGPGTTCDMCPPLPQCPEGSLFGQRPFDPGAEPSATTSEGSSGFIVSDNFSGVAGTIEAITWWGLDLRPVGNGFEECAETDTLFSIEFRHDAAGEPGTLVCADVVTATRTPLNIVYHGAQLNEYHVDLFSPCTLTRGWIRLFGHGDPNCWFLWMTSPQGDGHAWCDGCQPEQQDRDFAFCLEGQVGGIFGACCEESTGFCEDEKIEIVQCLGEDERFTPNALCDQLNPPCGIATGACCFGPLACSIEFPEDCDSQAGNWIGPNTLCSQCPCVAECPPNGQSQTEPSCGEGFENMNGGCEGTPPAFTPISIGDVICGVAGFYESGGDFAYDSDWYELQVDGPTDVIWEVIAEFPVETQVFNGTGGCPGEFIASTSGGPCDLLTLLPFSDGPQTFWFSVVATGNGDLSSCPGKYTARLPFPFGCAPGDVNVDTFRDGHDVQSFVDCVLTGSTPGGNCACADIDGQNGPGADDIQPFVEILLN